MAQVGASDITVNDVVAFLVELAAILALSAWGFRAGSGLLPKVLLGLGTPAAAIALWNMFAAPRSVFAVPAARLSVKVLLLLRRSPPSRCCRSAGRSLSPSSSLSTPSFSTSGPSHAEVVRRWGTAVPATTSRGQADPLHPCAFQLLSLAASSHPFAAGQETADSVVKATSRRTSDKEPPAAPGTRTGGGGDVQQPPRDASWIAVALNS